MILCSTTSTLPVCGGRLCSQSQESIKKNKTKKKGLKGGKDTEEKGGSLYIV